MSPEGCQHALYMQPWQCWQPWQPSPVVDCHRAARGRLEDAPLSSELPAWTGHGSWGSSNRDEHLRETLCLSFLEPDIKLRDRYASALTFLNVSHLCWAHWHDPHAIGAILNIRHDSPFPATLPPPGLPNQDRAGRVGDSTTHAASLSPLCAASAE